MGQIISPETSLKQYQYTLRKSQKSTKLFYTNGSLNDANKYDISGPYPI